MILLFYRKLIEFYFDYYFIPFSVFIQILVIKRTNGDPVDYQKGSIPSSNGSDVKVSPDPETSSHDKKETAQPNAE